MAFIDRVVEHPGRYTLTNADTGTVLGTFDLVRAEGEVTEPGTLLNANNLNTKTQLDGTVEDLFTAAGMTGGTAQNEMSDALKFLLENMDPEIETTGSWRYITMAGYFVGWYSGSVTAALTEQVGSLYHNSESLSLTYPTALAAPPIYVGISAVSGSYDVWAGVRAIYQTSTAYRLVTTASRASATYSVRAFVFAQLA